MCPDAQYRAAVVYSIFVWGGRAGIGGSGHGSRGDGSYVTGQTSGRPVSNQSFTNTQQITSPTCGYFWRPPCSSWSPALAALYSSTSRIYFKRTITTGSCLTGAVSVFPSSQLFSVPSLRVLLAAWCSSPCNLLMVRLKKTFLSSVRFNDKIV